jgi:predicted transcriptional regulator
VSINDEFLVGMTAQIVSAYVANNPIPKETLSCLVANVSRAVGTLSGAGQIPEPEPQKPAVNPKRSVFPDYIVCLEDGLKFKSLKRHLQTKFGMTAEGYRTRWNLPHDYPMVAPNYSAERSALAKKIGLGRKAPAPPKVRARNPKTAKVRSQGGGRRAGK